MSRSNFSNTPPGVLLKRQTDTDAVAAIAARLSCAPVSAVTQVLGGGNNRIFRIEGAAGSTFALKVYFAQDGGGSKRLRAEFNGLEFLWRNGVRRIPQPIAHDAQNDCALYTWVDGTAVGEPRPADVDAALDFMGVLKKVSLDPAAPSLGPAREACLSASELVSQIRLRRERLDRPAQTDAGLSKFLFTEFDEALVVLVEAVRRSYASRAADISSDLARASQTLSPSDFGFHNALRQEDGSLVFLDFEYFGWDDPVKLASDFLLHPAMHLTDELRERFSDGVDRMYGGDLGFTQRLDALFALYGLRWAMIALNEYVSEDWARRSFARGDSDRERVLGLQLEKARMLVGRALKGQVGNAA
jgi:hypothetical protein